MVSRTLTQWLEKMFKQSGSRTALSFLRDGRVETRLTCAQLQRETDIGAPELLAEGVSQGDRVILWLRKSVDAVVAYLALQRIGAVAIPLNPGFKDTEMQYLLSDARARLVLCDTGRSSRIRGLDGSLRIRELPTHQPYVVKSDVRRAVEMNDFGKPAPDDPAVIIYTSGTTGEPKGAILTHRNLTHDAANVIDIWEISAEDVFCHALPLFHVHGLGFALHTALLSGAHVVMVDRFDAPTVLDVLSPGSDDAVCSVFMAVPAMYTKLMDVIETRPKKPDFSNLRLLASGSAPLRPTEFRRITTVFGQEPLEREGMTETGMNFSNPLKGKRVPGSVGLPLPGLQVRLVDPHTLEDVGAGQVGEIWLKSHSITPGYWRKPEATRESFIDGWFRTGDLGSKDADGYYYLTDRIKHIIITGGENVSAKEVETVINRIPGVVESSVTGVPDPRWGERVVAAVVVKPGTELKQDAVIAFCKSHLHDWKCPKEIKVVDALPRNTMGKILKEDVRQFFPG